MEAHYTKLQATLLFCTLSWTIFKYSSNLNSKQLVVAFEEMRQSDNITSEQTHVQIKKDSTDVWQLLQVNNTPERGCLCTAGLDL